MRVCTEAAGWIPQPGINPGLIDHKSITGFTHEIKEEKAIRQQQNRHLVGQTSSARLRPADVLQREGRHPVGGSGLGFRVRLGGVSLDGWG